MNSFIHKALLIGTCAVSLSSLSQAAVLITVTGSGAGRELTTTAPATWNFTWNGSTAYSFNSAQFSFKSTRTLASDSTVTMTLWKGYGGNTVNNSIATIGAAPVQVTIDADASFSSGYAPFGFLFASGTLAAGNYSVQLTTNVASGILVKTGTVLQITDAGTPLPTSEYNTDGNTQGTSAVPEPSIAIMGLLAPALLLMRRRRA